LAGVSDLVIRLFLASHGAVRLGYGAATGALELVKAVHTGLWLGALSPDALARLDAAVYRGEYGYHATAEHNLRGLFDWERDSVEAAFPRGGRVLVTAAGGGREVLALRRLGYSVDGYECNEALRGFANRLLDEQGAHGEVRAVPRDECPDVEVPYEAAVVGWGSLSYVRGSARRRRFLARLRAAVREGAPVLVSFYARSYDSRRLRVVARTGSAVGRALGREPVELGDVLDPTYQHYFDRDELRAELESAGFALERFSREGFAHALARAR
jgi:hypothetical protein